jgi:P-type Cu2+ transporter
MTATLQKALVNIEGMRCAGCVSAVEKHLLATPGVVSASVNLLTAMAVVEHEPELVSADLTQRLTDRGFPSQLRDATQLHLPSQAIVEQPIKQLLMAIGLLMLSVIGHFGQSTMLPHHSAMAMNSLSSVWWHWGLATVALFGPGRFILTDGWQSLSKGHPNMHSLVGMGVGTSYVTSLVALAWPALQWECFFDEPVMLVGAMLLGKSLEAYAKRSAAQDFDQLLSLQPPTAHLLVGDRAIEVPVTQLQIGDFVRVLPGETVPVDGRIRQGTSSINESLLTGESQPVIRQVGDQVTAGTSNQAAVLEIQVDRLATESLLAKMVGVVTNAQARKVPVQQLADVAAGYFAYGVMALALLTVLGWYGFGAPTATPLLTSLKAGIAVLAIACPCALGLATPTAILVGTGIGARRGLLVKGGDVLEKLRAVQTVVFDKTGTLTQGQPTVQTTELRYPAPEFWPLAAMAAAGTNHPLAGAIVQHSAKLGYQPLTAISNETVVGLGSIAQSTDRQYVLLGSAAWLQQHGVAVEQVVPYTAVYVAIDGQFAGLIGLADPLRPEAMQTVKDLQHMGIEVVLLTGDQLPIATKIAAELGITQVFADVRPTHKATVIQQLQTAGATVAMVGDGLNDAPALAVADVGLAIGDGTGVAIETADVVLMLNKLSGVVTALRLGQATGNKIRQNLFWAVIYNCLGIPVAAGLLHPWHLTLSPAAAGACMAMSSVSVVLNSISLRWILSD